MSRWWGTAAGIAAVLGLLYAGGLRLRAHPDFVGGDGLTRLQRAAAAGDVERMRRLLEAGADPEAGAARELWLRRAELHRRDLDPDPNWEPLLLVARAGEPDGVRLLMNAGVQPVESTVSWLVRYADCPDCLRALLENVEPGPRRGTLAASCVRTAALEGNAGAAAACLEAAAGQPIVVGDLLHVLLAACAKHGAPGHDEPEVRDGDLGRARMIELLMRHGVVHERSSDALALLPYDRAAGSCAAPELAAAFELAGSPPTDGADGRLRAALEAWDFVAVDRALAEGADPDQRLADGRQLVDWVLASRYPDETTDRMLERLTAARAERRRP